jgi:DNA-binding Lrp family transcriptional regulator
MDSLDIRILRAHLKGGLYSLRAADPRLSVQTLSRRLGASRIAVSRRLQSWKDDGLWRRMVTFPNPDILGASLRLQGFLLREGRFRTRLENVIDRILEPLVLFRSEDIYSPVLCAEGARAAGRRRREL